MASERSERASISSVQWKSAIYIYLYVCIDVCFFYGMFVRASTNNFDSSTNWTFTRAGE